MSLNTAKKLIIFGCDGVLRSASWDGLYEAYLAIVQHLNKDYRNFFLNLEEFKKWWNADWKNNNEKLGIINPGATDEIFYRIYEPYHHLFPWTTNVLRQLSRKYTLAISSNASEMNIKKSLGRAAEYFSFIAGCECVKKLKPDPEGINIILKKLGFTPQEAIMIGDMAVDILAGKNAGTKTGAVKWGLSEWKDLLELNPDYKFEKPEDLLSLCNFRK